MSDADLIQQRAWHVFIVQQRNWQLWAYWLQTQARDMTRERS